jgi:uncharacterized protein (DUF1015 family)
MKLIKPFCGLRPTRALASQVASHPYDVLNRKEATEIAKDNPYSFLHINKPEIDLDSKTEAYDRRVYQKGRENLDQFIEQGVLQLDEEANYYVYKQIMGTHEQVGLVAVASVDAYEKNLIKKHEFTRPDKEDDRVRHMESLSAQVGPVFLTYKSVDAVNELIEQTMETESEYDFEADFNTRHVFWVVKDRNMVAKIGTAFDEVNHLYVADGHHRSAAAQRIKRLSQGRNPNHTGEESYNFFLVVLFPDKQVQILDYNRVVKIESNILPTRLLNDIGKYFDVFKVESATMAKPSIPRCFGLYLNNCWYQLTVNNKLRAQIDEYNPTESLDVSIMQNTVFEPLLGIKNQRTDKRVDFVGGIRGLEELEKRVNSGEWQAAVAFYPTSVESLMAIADADEVMPPKSTWFEPKLKSGLVVHMLG